MDKKQEILTAAFSIFCEKGYHLSLSELASAVDLRTPSLYSHFSSKDDIIEQILRIEIDHYYEDFADHITSTKGLNCQDTLKYIFEFIIRYFSQDDRLRFWRAIPFIPNPKLQSYSIRLISDQETRISKQLEERFSEGQLRGEIRSSASQDVLHLFFCLIQGVLDGMILYSAPYAETPNRLFELFWDSIKNEHSN